MDQNKYYKTNSFYLAAFISAKGVALIDVEKNFNRVNFIFPGSEEVNNLVRVFNFGNEDDRKLLVNFKKVQTAIKQLKSLIYD